MSNKGIEMERRGEERTTVIYSVVREELGQREQCGESKDE